MEVKRNIMHLKQLQEIRDHKIKQERQRQEEMEKKRKNINMHKRIERYFSESI